MAKCPDCDRIEIFSIPSAGNGKCSHCHGDGKSLLSGLNEGIMGEPLDCNSCNGSGDCQTCGGSGIVDDVETDYSPSESRKAYQPSHESSAVFESSETSNDSSYYDDSDSSDDDTDVSYDGGSYSGVYSGSSNSGRVDDSLKGLSSTERLTADELRERGIYNQKIGQHIAPAKRRSWPFVTFLFFATLVSIILLNNRSHIDSNKPPTTSELPVLKAKGVAVSFFSGINPLERNKKIYRSEFTKPDSEPVFYELGFQDYPSVSHPIDFQIKSIWHDPQGGIACELIANCRIESNWSNSQHWQGTTNIVEPGDYDVEFFVGGQKVATGSFRVRQRLAAGAIRTKVENILAGRNITNVVVREIGDGIVAVSGAVENPEQRRKIIDLASAIPEVKRVVPEFGSTPSPNELNRMIFTGFWKADCNQRFGMEIKPYRDNLYSASFCGPGGCSEPGEWRQNTPIVNDPEYVIVSSKEIQLRRGDGNFQVYYKCSTDPDPKRAIGTAQARNFNLAQYVQNHLLGRGIHNLMIREVDQGAVAISGNIESQDEENKIINFIASLAGVKCIIPKFTSSAYKPQSNTLPLQSPRNYTRFPAAPPSRQDHGQAVYLVRALQKNHSTLEVKAGSKLRAQGYRDLFTREFGDGIIYVYGRKRFFAHEMAEISQIVMQINGVRKVKFHLGEYLPTRPTRR